MAVIWGNTINVKKIMVEAAISATVLFFIFLFLGMIFGVAPRKAA